VKDNQGNTPLQVAERRGNREVVDVLKPRDSTPQPVHFCGTEIVQQFQRADVRRENYRVLIIFLSEDVSHLCQSRYGTREWMSALIGLNAVSERWAELAAAAAKAKG
jgi:hypothetical protein